MAAEATGATLKWLEVDERGVLQWEGKNFAQDKTHCACPYVQCDSTINPIAQIAKEAKRVGAVLVVDGAQGSSAHQSRCTKSWVAISTHFSGHKCYGPTGIGVLYGKKELLEKMPPVQGGGDMIEQVYMGKTSYQKPPLRFEAGTPQIASAIALKTALEFVEKNRRGCELLDLATRRP